MGPGAEVERLLLPAFILKKLAYILLLILAFSPLFWKYAPSEVMKPHPNNPVEYNLQWFVVSVQEIARPLIYLTVFLIFPQIDKKLLLGFLFYESLLLLDFWVNFRQTPFRSVLSYVLGGYIILNYVNNSLQTRQYKKIM